jgi:putative Ca2+/H+ antiporter (TMEM165/GDT1 family)
VLDASASLAPAISIVAVAYSTVFLAELVGDKAVYTIAALGLRFRPWPVLGGIALAFAGKMLAAVLLGKVLLKIPGHWTSVLSAFGFFACAIFIWFREPGKAVVTNAAGRGWLHAAGLSFSSLFLTEWCDTGQIVAAALAAHTQELLAVWLGGTLALLTKGVLALTVGAKLSGAVPERLVRTIASVAYCVLGVVSLSQVFAA